MCPITRTMFRDPVDGGRLWAYVRPSCRRCNGAKDPLTGRALSSTKVTTNRTVRQIVRDWLDRHPDVTPDGWDSRELLEPSEDDGTRLLERDDVGVLRTWRAMCPALQERWPVEAQPEDWKGVAMENAGWWSSSWQEFGLTGAVPAEVGRLAALQLRGNRLTSVPAEIGQLGSLDTFGGDRAAHVAELEGADELPAEIGQLAPATSVGQLTSLEVLCLDRNQLDAGGDRAARVAGEVAPRAQPADELCRRRSGRS